jgi:hypothetical protein
MQSGRTHARLPPSIAETLRRLRLGIEGAPDHRHVGVAPELDYPPTPTLAPLR